MTTANKRSLSGPPLSTISINIEGFSSSKSSLLSSLCKEFNCDILCVQETHRNLNQRRPSIEGMNLVIERTHAKYGSAIFTKPNLIINSAHFTDLDDIEILTIELDKCTVTSIYKPPAVKFTFNPPANFHNKPHKIVLGDFNSHHTDWGYQRTNDDGTAVELWAEASKLTLIHDAKQPGSFNSARWRRSFNPDLIFVSESIDTLCKKQIIGPIPSTQHRPIRCVIERVVSPKIVPFLRRFNFKKADWNKFSRMVEEGVRDIDPVPEKYDDFVKLILRASCRSTPRGCRTPYIPGLTPDLYGVYKEYSRQFEENPFSEATITLGQQLIQSIGESRRNAWIDLVENIDMTHNSKKAWSTVRKLSNDCHIRNQTYNVTPDQIATQLLLNSKTSRRQRYSDLKIIRQRHRETSTLSNPFRLENVRETIHTLKNGKAVGLDNIHVEQIKHLGENGVQWLLNMFNNCLHRKVIPKVWRKAHVMALLKPGKDANDPRSYRPISLLCHTYKLFERLLLRRLTPIAENHLIPEQAGFRPGRSCTSQLLNLTQYIEDGYERRRITGTAFIDLTAAYDTINIQKLLKKLYNLTLDYNFVDIVKELLSNRRFTVNLQNKKSRWRSPKNGLPQGSVLAPTLFNIYTNDQPLFNNCKSFIYADDLALATQAETFNAVEHQLISALDQLQKYYQANDLKPNPSKTEVCAFHLRNREASRKLNVTWCGNILKHNHNPKYLGVTLDRALTFKDHCKNVKMKVVSRNNILSKLIGSEWGANPSTLRTTALALSFSAAEYACPVWEQSCHTKEVDVALNQACRIITGCLKPTPIEKIQTIAGIAPPNIRRLVASRSERQRANSDPRHPLHGHTPATPRLKSRRSFLRRTEPVCEDQPSRLQLWKNTHSYWMPPAEGLAPGHDQAWAVWKTLNRLRTGVGRCGENLVRWGLGENALCSCGDTQTMQHLLTCSDCPTSATMEDLITASPAAILLTSYWKNI